MHQYLDVLRKIKDEGEDRMTRVGLARAIFAHQMRFNLQEGFPAVTTKKLMFKMVAAELLWFIEGSTHTKRLKEIAGFDMKIWDGDARQHFEKGKTKSLGELGPVYGKQWRQWSRHIKVPAHPLGYEWTPEETHVSHIDQLKDAIDRLKTNPFDRRIIVSAWNPAELDLMALPPCHMLFQFFATQDKRLSLHLVQRSCDMFLGVPFNIASYALLLSMVAHVTGFTPWECVITLNDAHIYHEHFGQAEEQLTRSPLKLPRLWLNPAIKDIDSFTMDDIRLVDYQHLPPIKAPLLTKDVQA